MQFSNHAIILLLLLSPCAAFVSGCEQPQTIATYTVARTAPPSPPFPISQVDQILVAVVPQADKAWFFKLNGKKPAVERQRQAFDAFVSTVQLAANSAEKPRWDLPDGWTEKAATEMRVATLKVPDVDGDLDLAVSSLPLTGDWEDFLVPNVNRWLNQLQCSRMTKPEVLELAEQIPAAEATATVFHLAGLKPVEQTIGNPHAGLGIPPPATAQQPASAAPRGGLKYDKPAEWLPGKMSMMRKAAFLLPGGGPADSVTVTSFPAGSGQMSEVQANVQRWAGQVGMQPPVGEALDDLTETIEVDGIEGTYVELTSPDNSARPVALYVTMLEREGQVWFFKMMGQREIVAGQKAAFREFLGSVEFE